MPRIPTVLSLFDLNPRKFGSMEEFTVFLSRRLQELGGRSILAFSHAVEPSIATTFEQSGATLEILDRRWGAKFYFRLCSLLQKYRPEVVHLHFYEQFSLLPVLLWVCGVKQIVYTDHCRQPTVFGFFKRTALKAWNALIPSLTGTRFIAISAHIKRILTTGFYMDPKRIEVVLNAVNVARFRAAGTEDRSALRRRLQIPADVPVVCAAASLIPEKGITYLLQAAKLVLGLYPQAMFVIAGDGRLSAALQEEARELQISDHVRFLGLLSDLSGVMAAADVLVVPSIWQEPAGLVVIEGMASGRPVVATRVGGIPEYIEDGVSGILVAPRSAEQIAAEVIRLLANPALAGQIACAARRSVEQQFNTERWVSETLDVYGVAIRARKAIAAD